ncbi:hypothetical protein GCM10023313_17180 [Mucilaginibacter defluvii]|uniref:Uncharacterized protein n=1 Tax=Mucilaginibacter defluvii TaxID=1196019 RepID=A0ABP9FSG1_9SPHI
MLKQISQLASNDTVQNVAIGSAPPFTVLSNSDLGTVKATVISLILSAVTQVGFTLIKKLIKKINGKPNQKEPPTISNA